MKHYKILTISVLGAVAIVLSIYLMMVKAPSSIVQGPFLKGIHEKFTARPSDSENPVFSFHVFGDCQKVGNVQWRMAELMEKVPADFVIITGDIADQKDDAGYENTLFAPFNTLINRIPFYPSPGNTDIRKEKDAKFYLKSFNISERYYSFDILNSHFISLDTNQGKKKGSTQYQWLKKDLSQTTKPWKFAFFHHPPYSPSERGGYGEIKDYWVPLFERYGVDIVFCGHDHFYARSIPIITSPKRKYSVIYIITGGGGGTLDPPLFSPMFPCSKSTYHFVNVSINGSFLTLKAINLNGNTLDQFEFRK